MASGFEDRLDAAVAEESIQRQRDVAYGLLGEFAQKRIAWYGDASKVNLRKLLAKDVIMFAARGVASADEFVAEAFRACESSSEETVIGNTWQAVIAAISSDTLDTGDMMTVRDGALWVCELKSQANTVNSSSFPQELRELKDKCAAQERFRRASGQPVRPAFCVLRNPRPVDEVRVYRADPRDLPNRDIDGFEYRYLAGDAFWPNRDIDGFEYRYLAGDAFWLWLTGFDSVEGLVADVDLIANEGVVEARAACLERLRAEMREALAAHGLGETMNDVLKLKKLLS